MKILLAPMEGVVDSVVRDLWTRNHAIDYCVTEFIRVTSQLLPPRVFHNYCPELLGGGHTPSGTPVFVQLLGGQPTPMAENAARADELGAFGVDINFGCPAKTVNRHDGGASLLKSPDRVASITESIRKCVSPKKPVTVKVRLGYSDKSLVREIAQAAEAGGAHWLTVHGRTKMEGYRPPAHWEDIATMKENVKIPVIANGDIWTPQDADCCRKISGCRDIMLGRGLVARPSLAWEIKNKNRLPHWTHWEQLLTSFTAMSLQTRHEKYGVTRTKQLTKLMGRTYPEFMALFDTIKRLQDYPKMKEEIHSFFRQATSLDENSKMSQPNC